MLSTNVKPNSEHNQMLMNLCHIKPAELNYVEHHTNLQFIKLLTMSKTNQDKAYKCLGVKLEW